MEVLPHALDLVVVRAVWRQKVQSNPTGKSRQGHMDDFARVNPIVVEDYMNDGCLFVDSQQPLQKGDEQSAGLALSFYPDQLPSPRVQSPGQISFDVLSRSPRFFLLTVPHPVETDFRVEMDIDFVFVDRYMPTRKRRHQLTDRVQTACFRRFCPRAGHGRPRASAPGLDQRQRSTHG